MPAQPAVNRDGEGGLVRKDDSASTITKANETQAARRNLGGRPKGSKNKPKGLIPSELAHQFLD